MQILIDFYIKNRRLINPFKTARSEVVQKDVLIIVFNNSFAIELPLSPSMGEMPMEVIKKAKNGELSIMASRALSYFRGMTKNSKREVTNIPLRTFHTITYDMNKTSIKEGEFLQRFKGGKENLDYLIECSRSLNYSWTVDFNEGLTEEELIYFLKNAELKNCLFIEQPLNADVSSLPDTAVKYWIDEGLKRLTPNEFLRSNYKGFMLKPLVFDYDEFNQWLLFGQKNKVPFFISGLACDNLYFEFLKYWNNFATWENKYSKKSGFFIEELIIEDNPYMTGDFRNVIEQVKSSFEKVCSLNYEC